MTEQLFELNHNILGVWGNADFSLTFSGNGINDGTVIINNKWTNTSVGANFRIVIKEGMPHLQIISKEDGAKNFQEFTISFSDESTERKLLLSNLFGVNFRLNKEA